MSEDTTNLANGDTGGAEGGSETQAAEAGAAEGAKETTQTQGSDSLLAEQPEAEAEKVAEGEEAKATEGDEKKDGEEDGKDKEPDEITPESYGDFEIPDGMPVNQPLLDAFKVEAANLKLDKKTAQALVSFKVKEVQDQNAAFLEQRKAWVGELKADPDFGGQAFDANVKTASLTLRQFDQDGAALKALQGTGLDNHPAIVKLLHRVGVGVADDKVHTSKSAGSKPEKPLGEALFGDMFKRP